MISNNYRRYCISQIIEQFYLLDSSELERVGHFILEDICNKKLYLRGQTVEGESVGYTLDSFAGDGTIVGEYSRQQDYFDKNKKFKKILKDIRHSINLTSQVKTIYLISNQKMSPSAEMALTKLCHRMDLFVKRHIEIYDSRKIAEYIVDNLFIKKEVLEKIEEYLPLLKELKNMQVITNSLPSIEVNYINRNKEENEIVDRLKNTNHLLIAGISGIGKTSIIIKICHEIKQEYDIIIWLDGTDVTLNNLKAVTISQLGIQQNLIGLLNTHKTLVIIDSLENDTENIIKTLIRECNKDSKVLVSAQTENKNICCHMIEFMENEQSRNLLNLDLGDNRCPDDVFIKITEFVGGYPLVLSLINALVKLEELSWKEIESEFHNLTQCEDSNGKRTCDRIVEKHLKVIGRELAAIRWLETSTIELGVLKSLIGAIGIAKLKKRALIPINSNRIKIHDIIFNSINQIEMESYNFSKEFVDFFKYHVEQKNSIFFKALYTHKNKIADLFTQNPELGIMLYCYLHILSMDELDSDIESKLNYEKLLANDYIYSQEDYYSIISLVEFFEVERRDINLKTGSYPNDLGEDRVAKLKKCIEMRNIPDELKIEITHHLGKFYKQALNDEENAERCFILALGNPKTEFAARLQLARLYRKSNVKESEMHIRKVLDTFKVDRSIISPTTTLGAFEDLRSKEYRSWINEYINEPGLLEDALFSSFHENFDQPFRVLANLAGYITYTQPERFREIMQQMPIPSEESISLKLAFVAGELYKGLGKSYIWEGTDFKEKIESALRQAAAYYSKVTRSNPYQDVHIAENFILLNDGIGANRVLLNVPNEQRDAFWYYRYAQALEIVGVNYNDALVAIDAALKKIEEMKLSKYESAFRREKAIILRKMDAQCTAEYQRAYDLADTKKFKEEIRKECEENGIQIIL